MYSNCVHCKRFASLNRYRICDRCVKEDEELLKVARELLHRDGQRSVFDLAEQLEVKPERIFTWIDQNRLPLKRLQYLCPKCGGDLLSGLCECQIEQALTLPKEEPVEEEEPVQRYHCNRRVLTKCEEYWDQKSKIRKRQKRDIWIST